MDADADGDVVTEVVIVSTDIDAPKATWRSRSGGHDLGDDAVNVMPTTGKVQMGDRLPTPSTSSTANRAMIATNDLCFSTGLEITSISGSSGRRHNRTWMKL